jgi:hypothetical protein
MVFTNSIKPYFNFFCLIKRNTAQAAPKVKIKALNLLFVRKSLLYKHLQLDASNFNSFLKLKFFKNVLTEILKINSFIAVAKTDKFKAINVRLRFCNQIFRRIK